MKYQNESDVLKSLGIANWRELSRDRFLSFAAMMPEMPSDVALKVIEQFPTFKEFAVETLNGIEASYEKTLAVNGESETRVHEAFADVRRILEDELNRDTLTADEKSNILSLLIETAKHQSQKDTEGKRFLKEIFAISVSGIVLVVAAGLVFVGAKAAIENGER